MERIMFFCPVIMRKWKVYIMVPRRNRYGELRKEALW